MSSDTDIDDDYFTNPSQGNLAIHLNPVIQDPAIEFELYKAKTTTLRLDMFNSR